MFGRHHREQSNMRQPAKPMVNFYTRISVEADERRRRLQTQLECSAGQLAEQALQSLESRLETEKAAA
jgi:hypothetical protein